MSVARALTFLLVTWIALILVASGQAVLPIDWPVRIPGPDVVLLVVLFLGLSSRGGLAGVCALSLVLGYFADLFAGSPKGLHMVAYALCGIAARGASSRILVRGHMLTALVALLFSLGCGALIVLVRTSLQPSLGWSAMRLVPPQALVTTLTAPFLFALLRRLDRRFVRDPRILGTPGGGTLSSISDGNRLA
jgi:cell shape-determining protein MreD